MKVYAVPAVLFFIAAVLYGGLLAVYMGGLGNALPIAVYGCIAATGTAAMLGPWLRRRAVASGEAAGGLLDGMAVMALAYAVGVILAAGHDALTFGGGRFFGVVAVGLISAAFLLPSALLIGAGAGWAFRRVIQQESV